MGLLRLPATIESPWSFNGDGTAFKLAVEASDAAKINIEQIFKVLSPHIELKTL